MMRFSSLEKLVAILIAFIAVMIAGRMMYSGKLVYLFLLWNIFLAWVPFRLSLLLHGSRGFPSVFIFMTWLLFFPNALYIITDLIHLEERTNVPLWYDALLLYSSASAGLLMAFISLYKVELFLSSRTRNNISKKIVFLLLFIGSFGVYLGRFLRWNSWNIVTHPVELTTEVSKRFLFPHHHTQTWMITLILTGIFSLLYFSFKELPKLMREKNKGV